jgi:hypothetical protein
METDEPLRVAPVLRPESLHQLAQRIGRVDNRLILDKPPSFRFRKKKPFPRLRIDPPKS